MPFMKIGVTIITIIGNFNLLLLHYFINIHADTSIHDADMTMAHTSSPVTTGKDLRL